jgi:hypothetical protein
MKSLLLNELNVFIGKEKEGGTVGNAHMSAV